jgi:hypothetical protein
MRPYTHTHARTHRNMQHLFLFHGKNGFPNTPDYYVIRTLHLLLTLIQVVHNATAAFQKVNQVQEMQNLMLTKNQQLIGYIYTGLHQIVLFKKYVLTPWLRSSWIYVTNSMGHSF